MLFDPNIGPRSFSRPDFGLIKPLKKQNNALKLLFSSKLGKLSLGTAGAFGLGGLILWL